MRVMYLATYSPSAVKGLIDGSDRVAAGKKLFGSVGGKLVDVMFTRGEYDVVATVDMPDQKAAAAAAVAARASGAFTKLVVLEELDMGSILPMAGDALKVFEPAG